MRQFFTFINNALYFSVYFHIDIAFSLMRFIIRFQLQPPLCLPQTFFFAVPGRRISRSFGKLLNIEIFLMTSFALFVDIRFDIYYLGWPATIYYTEIYSNFSSLSLAVIYFHIIDYDDCTSRYCKLATGTDA